MVATTLPAVVRVIDLPTGTTVTGAELFEAVQTSASVGQSVQLSLSQIMNNTVGALPTGGGTGQILNKLSAANYTSQWSSITQFVAAGTSLATTGVATSIVVFVPNQGITSTQIANNAVGTNQISSSLGIASSLSIGTILTVTGTAIFNGTTIYNATSVFNNGIQVTGTSQFTGSFNVAGTSIVTGNLGVVGTSLLTGAFGLVGTSLMTGVHGVVGTSLFTGSFGVVGTTQFTGIFNILGTTNLTGAFAQVGTSLMTGLFGVSGTSAFTGTFGVVGTSLITGVYGVVGTTLFTSGAFGIVGTTLVTGIVGIVGTSSFTGMIQIGAATSLFMGPSGAIYPTVQLYTTGPNASLGIIREVTPGIGGALLALGGSKGTPHIGSYSALVTGDGLGSIWGVGDVGSSIGAQGAAIIMQADGNWSVTSAPGRILFNTAAVSATAASEAMRITSSQGIAIGTSTDPGAGKLIISTGLVISAVGSGVLISSSTGVVTSTTSLPGSNFVLLNTLSPNNVASTNDTSSFTSTYRNYMITFENVCPATQTTVLQMQFATSGSNFITGSYLSNIYNLQGTVAQDNTTTVLLLTNNRATSSMVTSTVYGYNGFLKLFNPAGTVARKHIVGEATYIASQGVGAATSNLWLVCFNGLFDGNSNAVTGVNFSFNSGNIQTGTIKIYGMT